MNTNQNQQNANTTAKNHSVELNELTTEDAKLKSEIDSLRSAQESMERANRWLTFFAVSIGALLGAGGFLASQSAAHKSSDAQPLLKRREEISSRLQIIADLEDKISIGTATFVASNALRDAANANKQAKEATLEQAKLNASNLELQATIEHERTARVQLSKSLAYRSLNMGELGDIRRATYAYKDVALDILYCVGDPEVGHFAASVKYAFDIWKPDVFPISSFVQPGLTVEYDPNDLKASEAAKHFFDALDNHGFRVNGPFPELPWTPKELLVQAVPQAKLRLVVGERPAVYLPAEERR